MMSRPVVPALLVVLAAVTGPAWARAGSSPLGSARLAFAAPSAEELTRATGDAREPGDTAPMSGAARAAALSLLLPGLGQMTQGHTTRGAVFLALEGALWTTVIVSEIQHGLREDAALEQATVFAGVQPGTHTDTFYRDVAHYRSSDDYNAVLRREARAIFSGPDSLLPAFMDSYEQSNGYFGTETWYWQSYPDFTRYLDLRHAAQIAMRRASFAIGGALANRLFAVIDATRSGPRRAKESGAVAPPMRFAVHTDPVGRTTCALVYTF